MKEGLSFLIEILRGSADPVIPIQRQDFVDALRNGIKTEPEQFELFIYSYKNRMKKVRPDWNDDEVNDRTLKNIASYCVLADYESFDNLNEYPGTLREYIDDLDDYGPAMEKFANYIGEWGPNLSDILFR